MRKTLDQVFSQRAEGIDTIFTSYSTLYQIYIGGLKAMNVNKNTLQAIQNAKDSVEQEQKKISNQLHVQGFILLTGAAEALLKDVFVCLLRENFNQISLPASINFSASEIQEVIKAHEGQPQALSELSSELGGLTVKKIYSSKNPIEKINFQNVATTRQVLEQYFGIKFIDSDYLKRVHRYWQVRHTLIHNAGIIDERFLHNVKQVSLLARGEKVGSQVKVAKKQFDEAEEDFLKLFNELDQLVIGTGLNCSLIA